MSNPTKNLERDDTNAPQSSPSLTEQILSAIPGNPWVGLQRAESLWKAYREGNIPAKTVVTQQAETLGKVEYDVVICGGTLGILLGAALAKQGWRVALLERGKLRGRAQEWNISRREMQTFVRMGLLDEEALGSAIASEYNPARVSFGEDGDDLWVRDVLNVGVDPQYLLEALKQTFLSAGGTLMEHTPFQSATVYDNGVQIQVGNTVTTTDSTEPTTASITARLLIDAMGHFSPIVQQARKGRKPDAVCLVVGTCATGYNHNDTGDLIVSFTPIKNQCQYFWEAFPARDGRTTYLFTYLDAHPDRIGLTDLFEDYFALLPGYQSVALEQLDFERALFGFFPCYKDSPLQYEWDRTLAVGDSSGSQSPLSFGGFGAMVRHLERLTNGIHQALTADALSTGALSQLQPYQPNLSVTWLFQKSMSVGIDQQLPPERINTVLTTIFAQMNALGDDVLRPFLQDVVQFPALARTMLRTSTTHPGLVLKILPQVGLKTVLAWTQHFGALGVYHLLNNLTSARTPQEYRNAQRKEAFKYGSGQDYQQH